MTKYAVPILFWILPALHPACRAEDYPFTFRADDHALTPVHMGQYLLDAPAGQHGFVTVQNGHFFFEDGTRVRFWGVNIVGDVNFPPHEQAVLLAGRFAKLGVNIVRFHWFDFEEAPGGIWKTDDDGMFDGFDPAQLERMDYFIATLKKHGIYVNMNLLCGWPMNRSRPFRNSRQFPKRSKNIVLFHPHARTLLKEFARDLLTHHNPYLGHPLAEDPVLALLETVNETDLFTGWRSSLSLKQDGPEIWRMDKRDLAPLYASWHRFLRKRYNNTEALRTAWREHARQGLLHEESLEEANIDLRNCKPKTIEQMSTRRIRDTLEFLYRTEHDFYTEFISYLKTALHVRCPVTASQHFGVGAPTLYARYGTADYLDTHGYWNHPRTLPGIGRGLDVPKAVRNTSLFPDMDHVDGIRSTHQSPILRWARMKVHGKPLTISEWNQGYPSDYAYEVPVLVPAYAALQDWDGLMYFAYTHRLSDLGNGPITAGLRMRGHVSDQILFMVMGFAFQKRYVRPAEKTIQAFHPPNTLFDDAARAIREEEEQDYGGARIGGNRRIPDWIPLRHRIERTFAKPSGAFPALEAATGRFYRSDTGELTMDLSNARKSILKIDAPKLQGAMGALSTRGAMAFSSMSITSKTDGAILLLSMDDRPLAECKKALLVKLARQKYTQEVLVSRQQGNVITDHGREPCLLEHVLADVHIMRSTLSRATIFVLDETGSRRDTIRGVARNGSLAIQCRNVASPWIELEVQ